MGQFNREQLLYTESLFWNSSINLYWPVVPGIWMEKYKCKYEFISISTSFFIWERDSLHVQWGWFPSHAGKYYSSKYKLQMTMELNNLEFTDIPYPELDGREARSVVFAKPK